MSDRTQALREMVEELEAAPRLRQALKDIRSLLLVEEYYSEPTHMTYPISEVMMVFRIVGDALGER